MFKKCLVVACMAASILGASACYAAKEVLLDKIIAIVDDDIVMQSELDRRVETIAGRLQRQGTTAPVRSVLEARVLNQLVLESIQLQRAERAGIRISDDVLNQTISNIASSNNMSLEEFEAQLALEGETYSSARESRFAGKWSSRGFNRVRLTDGFA